VLIWFEVKNKHNKQCSKIQRQREKMLLNKTRAPVNENKARLICSAQAFERCVRIVFSVCE
jgi:hypothetical protein